MKGSNLLKIMAMSLVVAGCSTAGAPSAHETSPAASPLAGARSAGSTRSEGNVLDYSRPMKSPMSLEVQALNGEVRAVASSSDAAEVRATKTVRRGDPNSQRVVVSERPEATVVCVLYADEPDDACAAGRRDRGSHSHDGDQADIRIDFDLRVPAEVSLRASTLNGGIEARELRSEIHARTLNGKLQLSSTGRITGNTLNGSILAAALAPGEPDTIDLSTSNGKIELGLADRSGFDIDASTLRGRVTSDFPLPPAASGFGPVVVRGAVGGGGAALRMKTLNGDIEVKRQQ